MPTDIYHYIALSQKQALELTELRASSKKWSEELYAKEGEVLDLQEQIRLLKLGQGCGGIKVKSLAIKVTEALVDLGLVPDCTDTDSEDEVRVQDVIEEVLSNELTTETEGDSE